MSRNPLRSSASFRRLWFARLVSNVGDGAALVALVLYVRDLEHGALAVAALLIAETLPRLFGPAAGAFADRLSVKWLMVSCEAAQVIVYGAIAWLEPPFAPLVGLVVVASVFDTLFGPAVSSAVPDLVERPQLMQANAWLGTTLNLQVAVGPVVAAAAIAAAGTRGAFAVNAVSFGVSALVLATLPAVRRAPDPSRQRFLRSAFDGVAYVARTPLLGLVLLGIFVFIAFTAVDNVALVFLIRDSLGATGVGFAVTVAAFGVGMLAGSVLLSLARLRIRPAFLVVASWVASGLASIATGLGPALAPVMAAQAFGGAANAVDVIGGETLVQQETQPAMLGRVFGFYGTTVSAGSSLAYVLAGVLLAFTNPRTTFVVAGVASLLSTMILAPFIVSVARRRPDAFAPS